jgi:hypothetical protein
MSADLAVFTNRCASFVDTLVPAMLKFTFANAILPALETCAAPAAVNGDCTWETCGSDAREPSMALIRRSTDGDLTESPSDVSNTIRSMSPEFCGETRWRMAMASVEGVFGRLKLFEKFVPISRDAKDVAKRAMTHKVRTTRR